MGASARSALLLLVLVSAVAGHFLVITPLVSGARGLFGNRICPAMECASGGTPIVTEKTMMMEAPPPWSAASWVARFHASSVRSREIWRGEFRGIVRPLDSNLMVELGPSQVTLSPEAPPGLLRGVRVDVAEPTADGSWRIVREGYQTILERRFQNGETLVLDPMELILPGTRGPELQGRWLVVTMLVSSPGGFSPLAHAHMDMELAQRAAAAAVRTEQSAPPRRVR